MRKLSIVAAVVALAAAGMPATAAQPSARASALCAAADTPETGLQGDVPRQDQLSGRSDRGYNCGLSVVGWSPTVGNANMAWAGHCAYIAGQNGTAVIDVHNPRRPVEVRVLPRPMPQQGVLETIHAMSTGKRALLAVGSYAADFTPHSSMIYPSPMHLWDVHDCAHPVKLTEFTPMRPTHNLTISADLRRLYSTMPSQVFDISDPRHPKLLGSPYDALGFADHEARISADGRRMYVGAQQDLALLSARTMSNNPVMSIVDIEGYPRRPARIVNQWPGRGHSVDLMKIKGRTYLMHSDEGITGVGNAGCFPSYSSPILGPAEPTITDITDERRVLDVSRIHLEVNLSDHCTEQLSSGVNASMHYGGADNPEDTRFVMLSMWNAGLRIVDVRNPRAPVEVAYFNPGTVSGQLDHGWAHVRYVPETGQIWYSSATTGFWVLELEPQVRARLRLPHRPALHPRGSPARPTTSMRLTPTMLPKLLSSEELLCR